MAKFQPGQSGNPNGRPKSNLNKLLSEYALKKDFKTKRELGSLVVEKLFKLAVEDEDMDAIRMIFDRLEGKVREPVELSGANGAPLIPQLDFSNWTPEQIDKFIEATSPKSGFRPA